MNCQCCCWNGPIESLAHLSFLKPDAYIFHQRKSNISWMVSSKRFCAIINGYWCNVLQVTLTQMTLGIMALLLSSAASFTQEWCRAIDRNALIPYECMHRSCHSSAVGSPPPCMMKRACPFLEQDYPGSNYSFSTTIIVFAARFMVKSYE